MGVAKVVEAHVREAPLLQEPRPHIGEAVRGPWLPVPPVDHEALLAPALPHQALALGLSPSLALEIGTKELRKRHGPA